MCWVRHSEVWQGGYDVPFNIRNSWNKVINLGYSRVG